MWRCRCNGLQGTCGKITFASTSRLRSGGTKSCGCSAVKDLTGQRYGSLLVLHRAPSRGTQTAAFWQVRCEEKGCGKEYAARSSNLPKHRNCGCNRRSRRKDLAGERFGLLKVVRFVGVAKGSGAAIWSCRCDCTGMIDLTTADLRSRKEPNCGCLLWQILHRRNNLVHGHSRGLNGGTTPTYRSWLSMRLRCSPTSTNKIHRKRYVDRGIRVCRRWDSFTDFLSDMGERPPGMTLDRKRNDRGYYPSNCRWATPKTQAQNRETTDKLRKKIRLLEKRLAKLER